MFLALVLAVVAGWLLHSAVIVPVQAKRTCERVALERRAFEQCLKFRPSCVGVTQDDFIMYYDNKSWLVEHCPVESAGGLQPEIK